jgi:ABC-type glycerol-3-phosphate transport system substrate-binding protein
MPGRLCPRKERRIVMKKKFVSKIVAMAVAVSMVGSLAACGSSDTETAASESSETVAESSSASSEEASSSDATEDTTSDSDTIFQTFDETVDLDIVAFVDDNEPDGLRSDPVTKWLEEKLNVNLYVTHVTEADWPTQLSAMLADNDLPDIFLLSDPTKQLPMLLEANSVLDYSSYLDDYAPNTLNDPAGQLMVAGNSTEAYSPDGGTYLWGLCRGSWDDGTQPTCGHYIRWDLYKKAGYPTLENFDTDMLDVMQAMVDQEPETEDGQKTYGIGAWFGDGQDWGEWFFIYGLAPQEGASLQETTGLTLAISTVDSTPIDSNQLTDPDGYFWRAVQFMNKANQRGLLDPDSFTQQSDVYEENLKAGKYVFNYPGWMSGNANAEFNKTEGNEKMFISIPAVGVDAEDRFGNMYRGERQYVINANSENPERCVALLDLVSTHEFSRLSYNGFEGDYYNVVDGVAVPTDEFLDLTIDDDFETATGITIYHHFMGYGNGTIDPKDGEVTDLKLYSAAAVQKKMNSTLQDFLDYYGQSNWADVYRAETKTTSSMNFISLSSTDSDITSYVNEIKAYRGKNVFNCVAAKTDEEFEALRDKMIEELKTNYHVDEVFQYFYDQAASQGDDIAKMAALAAEIE